MSLAFDAGLILLREGLEAVLVLAALAALLRRAAPERGGAHDDRVEAATCLAAAGLMLWTGGWLARSADPRAWTRALQARADRALANGALAGRNVALAVGGIGFLAVFREGAETALFLAALGGEGQAGQLALGIGVAAVLLLVLWGVVSRGVVRLPLRPLFLGTSVFLLVMAARFAAAAVQELQEQAALPFTPLDLPAPVAALGIPDSLEALVAAAAVLGVAAVTMWPRRAPAIQPAG